MNELELFKKIDEQIQKFDKITIFTHISPDGDCYGSGFGLKYAILAKFPKKIVAVTG
jgi:phosphoesterase RecJ-like protein